MNLTVLRANPAGNTTLIVEGDVPQEKYAVLGAHLLQKAGLEAEQVGFVSSPCIGGAGRLEMAGGEFCGNASRAFGYYLAQKQGIRKGTITIEISGCNALVPVDVDRDLGTAYAVMPYPEEFRYIDLPEPYGTRPLVCFSGIWHVILQGVPANMEVFEMVREQIYSSSEPEALGVMFLDEAGIRMVPIVYVHGLKTVFEENSCGSGSTAVAAWGAKRDEKLSELELQQPGGTLWVKIQRSDKGSPMLMMGGDITLGEPLFIHVDDWIE